MTEDGVVKIVALLGAFSIIGGLVTLLMIHTVFFGAIRKVEDHIATPGKQLDAIKHVWGNGPIGRWMRAIHLYFFFIFRRLPYWGRSIERRMGDEDTPVPRKLKMALMIPMSLFYLLTFIMFGCGIYLDIIP